MTNTHSLLSIESLSDQELLARTDVCAQEERSATARLLAHLREVQRRKLYCDLKLGSLHAYCHKKLRMSEGSAQRRIAVLKLTDDLPELLPRIESGTLSLTVAARLQSYFQKESKLGQISLTQKREIAQVVAGKSQREVETILRKNSNEPDQHQPESIRVISETHLRVSFNLRQEELLLLDRARGLLAHRYPEGLSLQELVVGMARLTLGTLDPAEKKSSLRNAPPSRCHTASPLRSESPETGGGLKNWGKPDSRVAGVVLKRELWKRDQSKCRNCGTYYRVQDEHDQPWAMGGATSLENMFLLCRNCNLRAAIRRFGLGKIEKERIRIHKKI